MKIQVLHNYGGARTNEQRILAGTYEHDDEQLFGLAGYLVANGHALALEPLDALLFHGDNLLRQDVPVVPDLIPNDLLKTPDYEDLTMPQIRELLKAYGKTEADIVTDMEADWRTRKAEIIAWLEAQ